MNFLLFSAPLRWLILLTTFLSLACVELVMARCSPPQTPDHAYLIYEKHSSPPAYLPNGYVVRVVCEELFQLVGEGNGFMTCRNRRWTNTFSCIDSRCSPLLDNIENGHWSAGDRSYSSGEVINFTCDRGYRPISSSQRVCVLRRQSDGSFLPMWEGETPRCEEVQCSRPSGEIENGETIVSSTSVGGTTSFRCRSGFVLIGNEVITCQEDGQWDGTIPFCYDIMLSPFTNELGVDIFFLFDASDSVGIDNFETSKRFAKKLVRQIGVTESLNSLRVGAASFSYSAEVAFHTTEFTSTYEVINLGINPIQFTGGGTDIREALILVKERMLSKGPHREGTYKAIFIITDGNAYVDSSTVNEARILKSFGVSIYCVAISGDVISRKLLGLASQHHKEHAFLLRNYGSIDQLVAQVIYKTDDCGVSENTVSRGRVVGGNDANPGAWPWQVLLEIISDRNYVLKCGGVLIDRFWVLTAAHCLLRNPTTTYTVVLGTTDLSQPRHQEIDAEEVIPHPDFDPYSYQNNIGLVKLSRAAGLNANVRPVCLPEKARVDRLLRSGPSNIHTAIVTGWGHTKPSAVDERIQAQLVDRLQQLAMPLKSRADCQASLDGTPEEEFFDESMFCAGYNNAYLGLCRGDSGGPLVKKALRQGQRRWTLIGLSSWGRGCAARNELDFFTNVPYFVDWIKGTMQRTQEAKLDGAMEEERIDK